MVNLIIFHLLSLTIIIKVTILFITNFTDLKNQKKREILVFFKLIFLVKKNKFQTKTGN